MRVGLAHIQATHETAKYRNAGKFARMTLGTSSGTLLAAAAGDHGQAES